MPPLRLISAILASCVLICLLSASTPILRAAGRALVVDDTLGPSDVVVVPYWTGEAGALEAADVVHAGLAARVAVLVGSPEPAEKELVRRGVLPPETSIWLTRLTRSLGVQTVEEIPNAISGTEAEGELLSGWSAMRGFRSVIVISTPDHSRRVRRVLRRSMNGRNVHVMIRAVHYSSFDPDRWWETRDGKRTEIVELQKLLFDVIRHPIS